MKHILFLLVVFYASATSYAGQFPKNYPNVIGVWRFNDIVRSSWCIVDSTGNNAYGILYGTAAYKRTPYGYGLDFGGQGEHNTSYVIVPHNAIQSPQSVTVVVRKRLLTDMQYQQSTQVQKAWDSSGNEPVFSYVFGLTYTPAYEPYPLPRTLNWCITNTHDLITDWQFPISKKYHTLICTYDYSTGLAWIYLDKNYSASYNLGQIDMTSANGPIVFGSQLYHGGQDWGDYDETDEIVIIGGAITKKEAYRICDMYGEILQSD